VEKKRRTYTEEQKRKILKEVMDKLPEGESLRGIAQKRGVSDGRVHEWIKSLGLWEDYAHVRELRAHTFFERINDIAFLALANKVDPNAARVAIDALKWTISRMNPKSYGERTNIDVNIKAQMEYVEFVKKLSNEKRNVEEAKVIDVDTKEEPDQIE